MFIRKIKNNKFIKKSGRFTVYWLLRLLFSTYRLQVTQHPVISQPLAKTNGVFYFWHQHIIGGMYLFYKLKTFGHCIVSPSSDGQLIGSALQKFGFKVLYGSPFKTSVSLVRKSLEVLKSHEQLCLIGDGSRGPAKQLQPGVTYLAKKSNLPLVFIDCRAQWKITFKKSWDQFQIPLPFSKIFIKIHEPIMIAPSKNKTNTHSLMQSSC